MSFGELEFVINLSLHFTTAGASASKQVKPSSTPTEFRRNLLHENYIAEETASLSPAQEVHR